jgi:peroxiredoxin
VSCSTSIWSGDRRAALRLAGLAVALAAAGCGAPSGTSASAPGAPGGAGGAPDFALRDLAGRTVRLSDQRGKVVLVNFWATWCVPCAAELPHLQRLYEKYRDRGFVVLAISMDGPESSAEVDPRARRYGLTFPVLVDEETRVVGVYNPKRTAPFSVFIDRGGHVVATREGFHAGDEVAVESEVSSLVAAGR